MLLRCTPSLCLLLLAVPGCSLLITPGENAARDPLLPDGGEADVDGGPPPCPREVLVASNFDDGEIYNGMLSRSGSDARIFMGTWDGQLEWTFFRFEIPPDLGPPSTVSLHLWGAQESGWGDNDHLSVLVEQNVDAPVVDGAGDLPGTMAGRPTLPLEVRWPQMGKLDWNTNSFNESPDLSPAFADLRARGGMQPGQHVQLWIRPDMEDMASNRDIATRDSSDAMGQEARLVFACP